MRAVGILLCAGSAARMGFAKLLTPICGKNAVTRSADALIAGGVESLVLTASKENFDALSWMEFPVPHTVVAGGDTRTASVRGALSAAEGDVVAIHDAARCFVSPALVARCLKSAFEHGSGVAAVPATDTVLQRTETGVSVLPRESLWLMQTPQAFTLADIRAAYERLDVPATDDCTLYEKSGRRTVFVESTPDNFKLTTPADWARAVRLCTRYGTGFDTHRLVENRALILGGVEIPYEKGLLGHSDADVLVHAVMDALLGAAALGDIGKHFPDKDPAYAGISSMALLARVNALLREKGFTPASVDATVIAQAPKLAPHIPRMCETIARTLSLPVSAVSVKATTTEGMNDEGRGLCISAQAVASLI